MRSLIIDDNLDFASALAAKLGDSSEVLFSVGLSPETTLDLAQRALERKLENGDEVSLVLINRELKLDGLWRQSNAGETMFAAQSWKHEPHFLLYSFRWLPDDSAQRVIRLPVDVGDLSLPSDLEIVGLKIEECLSFIDKSFKKIQHGFKQVSPTAVDVIRLISGAVKAGRIRSEGQFKRLEALLFSFSYMNAPSGERALNRAFDFDEAIGRLVKLYVKQGANNQTKQSMSVKSNPIQRVVVVDDEVIEEEGDYKGQSPWASLLDVVFDSCGKIFSSILPSELEADTSGIAGADLVLLDMDFELDTRFKGDRGYGGLELLKRIRHEFPRMPVVVMSRLDEIGLYDECMRAGCFDYLTKSWSGYRKFRTQESERDWFLLWQSRIEVPLRCRPFFEDIELLRRNEVVTRKEAQHFLTTLRDIESPNLETLRTLVAFFEQFVIGYLYYRGQTPHDTLDGCLKNSIFASNSTKGLPLAQVLRIIRNNVTHHSAYTAERPDAWLVLMLLRAFYLTLLSPTRLFTSPLMNYLNDKLTADLPKAFESDEHFFKNANGAISPANIVLVDRRNKLLYACLSSTEIELSEFKELADAFAKSLAVVLPRSHLVSQDFQLRSLATYDGQDIVRELIIPYKDGRRFKRGYELFSSVWWLFELYNRLVEPGRSVSELDKSLLRAMIVRCWIWYFQHLLKEPNEILFSSALEELAVARDTALASVERRVVQHFQKRKMNDFIPAYCLLVGLTYINETLVRKKVELEAESSTLDERLESVQEDLTDKQDAASQVLKDLLRVTEEVNSLEQRLAVMGPSTNRRDVMEVFLKLSERMDRAKQEKRELEEKMQLLPIETEQVRARHEEVSKRRAWVAEGFAALSDSAGGRMSVIDKADILARRVRRQFRFVERFAKSTFSISEWITSVMASVDFRTADSFISELRDALDEESLSSAGK